MLQRFHLLIWCLAVAVLAYVALDFWSTKNARPHKKFERLWAEDVELLEKSKKLPPPWFKVREIKLIGGTPETKAWLKRIQVPLRTNADGTHNLEVILVVWDESGKKGVMIQYDLVDINSGENVWELGRTLIVSAPNLKKGFAAFLEELRL